MSDRYFWDEERGMTAIRQSPDARLELALPPKEVRRWCATGVRPQTEEPARCPTCGRAEGCCCEDCPHCDAEGRPRGKPVLR